MHEERERDKALSSISLTIPFYILRRLLLKREKERLVGSKGERVLPCKTSQGVLITRSSHSKESLGSARVYTSYVINNYRTGFYK